MMRKSKSSASMELVKGFLLIKVWESGTGGVLQDITNSITKNFNNAGKIQWAKEGRSWRFPNEQEGVKKRNGKNVF